ncbi:dienelactone hydrolase family protein [Bradyrhizobium sp. USDA 4469]
MDVLVASPDETALGAVLLLGPIFGVDEDLAAIANDWAEVGYVALAPDYYHRVAPGPMPRDAEGFRAAIARWKKWDALQALADLRQAARFARTIASSGPIGVIGYCAGGELAALAAIDGAADVFAIFHAARMPVYAERLARVERPLTLHFGGADRLVPPEDVAVVQAAVTANPLVELFVHAGADHGYTFTRQPSYQPEAARHSFERARALLATSIAFPDGAQ